MKRSWVRGSAVVAATALSLAFAAPASATPLSGVSSVKADGNVVTITFNGGAEGGSVQGKITLLEDGIFRYNVDPSGGFGDYAKPKDAKHVAKIQAQPDTSGKYSRPNAKVSEEDGRFVISSADGKTTIELDKATAKMTIKRDGKVVMEESAPLDLSTQSTVQTLVKHEGENFFGGGTQNGRFIHTGNKINIANESNWVDGGVASPNPFYWSSEGYGVLRNTFADGSYDFGKTSDGSTIAQHAENELDAYYFVADAANGKSTAPIAQDLLQAYYKVTGNPVLLPEYAFYVGHLNAWNRDMWSAEQKAGYNKWQIKGGTPAAEDGGVTKYEKGGTGTSMQPGTIVETLNGTGPAVHAENIPEGVTFSEEFSARDRLDNYVDNDMPLGYFLPNDGYGAGYGQNGFGKTGGVNPDGSSSPERLAAVAANVENLKQFTDYANERGVATGLWTQSYLEPDSKDSTQWQLLRDFRSEVAKGGVTTLKTDVAWVGPGYSMALDGTKTAYDIVTEEAGFRPNIITLDGWAGTQRFGGIWTGDQTGGNWEYIRFHVPTFIGQSLSGNPNIGSDNDGIFGGQPVIATRDYQWKSFAPLMLDMDGWGAYAKAPQTHGDPYTGITRMYLKLKSQLMPYIYTTAASAANIDTGNGDTGMPFVRAILLSEDSAMANSTATQYEYTMGEDFLIAPVYQNTDGDDANNGVGDGNDVRNGIYLPGTSEDIWIDYFSGKQYRGGQVLNNFDAPLWKLPVFVKANAIVPMYDANNNPEDVDRTIRNVEFFATQGKNEYTLFEDTGTYVENKVNDSDKEYGKESTISYGSSVKTTFSSSAKGDTAVFTAGKSTGDYEGYKKDRTTTFIVNVSAEPTSVVAKNGDKELKIKKVTSEAEFKAAKPAAGEGVYFYNVSPNLNYNATAESEEVRKEGFSAQEVLTTPKLYVKFAQTDVKANEQTLEVKGFANAGELPNDTLNESLAVPELSAPKDGLTPTSIKLAWNKIDGATGYDILIDGMVNSIPSGETVEFTVSDLPYHSSHVFKIRTRTADGYSNWSAELPVQTLEDPWRNVPKPSHIDWAGGEQWGKIDLAFDHDDKSGSAFHSTTGGEAIGMPMTIDYGKVYQLDQFVYTPRQDNGGNGNVAKMKIETSVDGVHWKDHGVTDWDNSGKGKMDQKVADLKGSSARYLRLTVQESTGGFFSATELALYKLDGTEGVELGSIKGGPAVESDDYSHLTGNCLGRENRGTGVADWKSHIESSGADFNMNDAYDVYDMSFTMSKLDGGTKKTDKVSGSIAVIPGATSAKAGDVVTVNLYVDDAKNVNALGTLVKYDNTAFEFVKDSIVADAYTSGMENLSLASSFGDGVDSVNIALANKGDKDLYNGTGSVVTFQLRAKKDAAVELASTSWLVGPTCDFVEVDGSKQGELPEVPQSTPAELSQNDLKISLTNAGYPTDDGSNVTKLVQQGNFDGLFNGSNDDRSFELKWFQGVEGFDQKIELPLNMGFELKEPRALTSIELFNGAATSNGSITSIEAAVSFEDGTIQEFEGGDFATGQAKYTFAINDANKGKKVTKVEIKPLTSTGTATGLEQPKNRMLTIGEINFNYSTEGVVAEGIELGENATELFVGDVTTVNATVTPKDDRYPYFTATSSDPAVASVVSQIDAKGNQTWYLSGNKAGEATITVAAALNPEIKAEYKVTIKEGVSTAKLTAAIEKARAYSKDAYTEESYAKLSEAVAAGEKLLKSGEYSKADIASAALKIEDAIKGLSMRPVNEDALINTEANKAAVKAVYASSEAANEDALKEALLDYNNETYWHSDYTDDALLPDFLIFDLGQAYDLTDVTFLPRQGATNGDIFKAQVFVGASAEELMDGGTLLGTFEFENDGKVLANREQFKQMSFGAAKTQFVKVNILSAGGDPKDAFASAAEMRFYGAKHADAADLSTLTGLVDKIKAEKLDASRFTEETWTPFELAMKDAEELIASKPGLDQQKVVDELAERLDAARKALVEKPVEPVAPSKDELKELIATAQEAQTSGKEQALVAEFNAALANAQKVAADEAASEAQVKDAYTRLNEALAKLLADEGTQGGGQQGGNTGGATGGTTGGSKPGSQTTKPNGKPSDDHLAQTGDPATFAAAATGIGGGIVAAIGAFLRRRRS